MTILGSGRKTRHLSSDSGWLNEHQPADRMPWLLGIFCILNGLLPSYIVPSGTLRFLGSPSKLLAAALLFITIVGFVGSRRASENFTIRPGLILLVGYSVLTILVWGVASPSLDNSQVEEQDKSALILLIAFVGIACYSIIKIQTSAQRSFVMGCLAIGLLFSCAAGILQNALSADLHLFFLPPGFVNNLPDSIAGTGIQLIERAGATRAFGTSGHPIEFSVVAAVAVPLTLHFARFATERYVRVLATLGTGIALFSIPAGVSRSGLIAFLVVFLIYMWSFTVRQLFTALALLLAAVSLQAIAMPNTIDALWQTIAGSAEDSSILVRIARYDHVAATIRAHPIFGIGFGEGSGSVYGVLDNQWFLTGVQGGVVGIAALTLLSLGGVIGFTASLRCASTHVERGQAYALGAMFGGILVTSFTFDLFAFQQVSFVYLLVFGLLWSSVAIPFGDANRPGTDRGRVPGGAQLRG